MKYKRIIWTAVLFLTAVMSWGQETVLTANDNGTWTLPAMPGYDLELMVEFDNGDLPEGAIRLIDNGNGTWTLAAMPGYDVELLLELEETKGDLNGDGKIDIADAVNILSLMAEGRDSSAADLNGDGKVDIADFVSVLNLMAEQ